MSNTNYQDDTLLNYCTLKKSYEELDWYGELNKLGKHWVANTPGMEVLWNDQIQRAKLWIYVGICMHCSRRLEEYGQTFGSATAADDIINIMMRDDWYLHHDLVSYDPSKSALGARMSQQIKNRWTDAVNAYHKRPGAVSLDTPISTDDDHTIADTIAADPEPDQEAAGILLGILVINFLTLRENGLNDVQGKIARRSAAGTISRIHRKILHYQLMFTEQITYYGADDPLPRQYHVDILKAFHELYYRHFSANIKEEQPLTIPVIEHTVLKRKCDVIPENTDSARLTWKEHGFLQYEVMMAFLADQDQAVSLSTLNAHRKEYINALQTAFYNAHT